ncbi:hypothetical protein AZE42_13457 [Rhizopogon vesiculosus]|uniref:Uncharacterized protein n=1 Tax=Rhizopogon vesiculosus TaxID=180088 RepID=A0A1J8PU23_9AGAM|nr:hypothetical protein AZE42_13457 [Rhizopogon vesiculosus]
MQHLMMPSFGKISLKRPKMLPSHG